MRRSAAVFSFFFVFDTFPTFGIYSSMRNLFEGKKIHFIGVGGISMSALIKIAARLGAETTGSDQVESERFLELKKQGYKVYVGSNPSFSERADLVVCTAAIKTSDPERVAAGEKAISRSRFLSEICALFEKTVAVAGTHGKTTVSAMIACCLAASKRPFSAHIGGVVRNFNDTVFLSGSEVFVTEACEYKDSFLSLTPDVAVVLNAELDHGDFFSDEKSVYRSFSKFVRNVKRGGIAVLGEGVSSHIDDCAYDEATAYKYGEDFSFEPLEEGEFVLKVKGEPDRRFMTPLKGRHNLYNAAIAAFVSLKIGVEEDAVRMGLAAFLGVKRRYERMGSTLGGAAVIHDYAHHPSEIEAVMRVAREEGKGRLFVVFEPHTYSRTRILFDEFRRVLSGADVLILLPTYAARETADMGVGSKDLFCACNAREMYCFSRYDDVKTMLDRSAKGQDTVLILGAGKVEELALAFSKE